MKNNNKATTAARQFFANEYADYLRRGDLQEATRQVAHAIYAQRGDNPGDQENDWFEAERITRGWPGTITDSSQSHMFDKALTKSREWIHDIQTELKLANPNEAYRALRAVLHAIRDRLPPLEAADLAAQLPVLITGLYYTGWTPKHKPVRLKTSDEFLARVAEGLPAGSDAERVTRAVISVLERRLTKGELNNVREFFPEAMREMLTAR